MATKKQTAETTASKTEESPAVSEAPRDEGFIVCVAIRGGIQIHLVKDASEDTVIDAERDEEHPRVNEVKSKVLKLGDYVAVEEADPAIVEQVKAGEIEQLRYAEDERDVKIMVYEARSAEELVYVEQVFYSAEKPLGQGQFAGPLVGASARS